MIDGFYVLHQNAEKLILLVQMIAISSNDLPCFKMGPDVAVEELRQRLMPFGSN